MLRTDEAYLLDSTRLGEADLILTLFAREAGAVRGVARSAKKSRRRFGGALEPLSRQVRDTRPTIKARIEFIATATRRSVQRLGERRYRRKPAEPTINAGTIPKRSAPPAKLAAVSVKRVAAIATMTSSRSVR